MNRQGFSIPVNYTESGKLLGGLLELRNTIEAVFLIGLIGYPLFMWLQIAAKLKFVIMIVTLIPIGIIALMGIGGFSLFQFVGHVVSFALNRRILRYRRIKRRHEIKTKSKRKARRRRKLQQQKGE